MKIIKVIVPTILLSLPPFVFAGSAAEELDLCLVESISKRDKVAVARWLYTGMSQHHAVKDLSLISPGQEKEITKDYVSLFNRLYFDACSDEVNKLSKTKGAKAVDTSFNKFGLSLRKEFFKEPNITAYFSNVGARNRELLETDIAQNSAYTQRKKALEDSILASNTFPARPVWWHKDSVLAVGVIDGGKAMAKASAIEACSLLGQHGFHQMSVEVYDVVKIQKVDEWVKLAERTCKGLSNSHKGY